METDKQTEDLLKEVNDSAAERNAVVFVYIVVVIILGIVGNLMSFIFHTYAEKRKTVTSFLISSLAMNDLLASVALVDHIVLVRSLVKFDSTIGCRVTYALNNVLVNNSVILLVPIGVERCLKVCTTDAKFYMTKKKAIVTVILLNTYAVMTSCKHFVISGVVDMEIELSGNQTIVARVCSLLHDPELRVTIKLFHTLDVFVFLLANIILVVSYGILAQRIMTVRKKIAAYPGSSRITGTKSNTGSIHSDVKSNNTVQHVATTRSEKTVEKKINIMLGVITLSSVLSFVPYFYVVTIVKPSLSVSEYTFSPLIQIGWRSFMLSSCINPYIIGVFNRNFRTFVADTFRCSRRRK